LQELDPLSEFNKAGILKIEINYVDYDDDDDDNNNNNNNINNNNNNGSTCLDK